jgi:hypothetical protein
MNWRGALLSAGGLLLVLVMLIASGPGHASRGTESFWRTSHVRPQTLQRVAQKRDPDTDPGGLPGAKPDRNSDYVGQRGHAMERRAIGKEKNPTPAAKQKPDRANPDKSPKAPQ